MAQTASAEAARPLVFAARGAVLALGAGALTLAALSASAAAGIWPGNGFADADAASLAVLRANPGRESLDGLVVPEEVAVLARRAITSEPASAEAVRNLALYHHANGDTARPLMRLAARLSARDTATNMWLVEDYLHQGDMPRALALIDATLRSDASAGENLLPRLAQLLELPGAEAVLGDLLAGNPPWGHDFWSAVIEANNAPRASATLRAEMHRQGLDLAPGHDARLIAQLVDRRLFVEAFALHAAARTAVPLPPIDWRLGDATGLAITREPDGALRASALAGASGVVAQRLVELPRGQHSLRLASDAAAGQMTARITCAHLAGERTLAVTIPLSGTMQARFEQPSACRYVWLTLALEPGAGDRSLAITSLTLAGEGA